MQKLSTLADWDYLIGSVHYITPEWDVDNPKHLKRWTEQPVEEIWQRYFDAYTAMAESCLFDFLAHPDLVKKFGHRPEGDLMRFYQPDARRHRGGGRGAGGEHGRAAQGSGRDLSEPRFPRSRRASGRFRS